MMLLCTLGCVYLFKLIFVLFCFLDIHPGMELLGCSYIFINWEIRIIACSTFHRILRNSENKFGELVLKIRNCHLNMVLITFYCIINCLIS